MNLSEFRAWFEGFTESLDRLPNEKQWARIKEKVDEITSDPMPAPIFIERYVRPYLYWWQGTIPPYDGTTWTGGTSKTVSVPSVWISGSQGQVSSNTISITSNSDAWRHVGRCEAQTETVKGWAG
jgi:hypothetical protein